MRDPATETRPEDYAAPVQRDAVGSDNPHGPDVVSPGLGAGPPMTVEDAEQEAVEAAGLAADLEERVRQGDETITPDDIAEAERLGRFARLRVEAAQRKAEQRRKAAALEHAEAFKARLLEDAAGKDEDVVAAWVDVVASLRRLQLAADERWAAVDEQIRERAEVAMRLREEAGMELTELGVLPGRYNLPGFHIPASGIDVRQVDVHELVAEALGVGLSGSAASRVAKTGITPAPELPGTTRVTGVVGWPAAARAAVEGRSSR